MRSIVTPQFRKMLADLPEAVQAQARKGFERWKEDPKSVGWKSLSGMHADVYSVEIGLRYRAIGVLSKEHDAVVWMFAGSHETYNNYVELRRQMSQKNWLATTLHRLEALPEALAQRRLSKGKAPQQAHPGKKKPAFP